jgi:hypothetical protein
MAWYGHRARGVGLLAKTSGILRHFNDFTFHALLEVLSGLHIFLWLSATFRALGKSSRAPSMQDRFVGPKEYEMAVAQNRWLFVVVICGCLGLGTGTVAGCSDDDSSGNNNIVQADAGVDAAIGDTVRIKAVVWDTSSATNVPAAGVLVAFDAPGGERAEVTTGADGLASFEGVDWSLGDGAVTAYLADHTMVSVVNMDETLYTDSLDENQDLLIGLPSLIAPPDPTFVTISGTATAMDDTAHNLTVNTPTIQNLVGDSEWYGTGNQTWSVDVPTGETFVLQAVERSDWTALPSGQGFTDMLHQWMQIEYGPVTADETNIELDFDAYNMTTYTADVSVLMPTRTDSVLRTGNTPFCYMCTSSSRYCHGWPTYLDVVDSHNRIDISFLWVEPDYAQDHMWFCRVTAATGEYAQSNFDGKPTQDQQETLIDVPTWVTPADPTVSHDLYAPMEWTWYEDVNFAEVIIAANGIEWWIVHTGPNATTATVPQPPTGAHVAAFLGANATAYIFGGTIENDIAVRKAFSRPTRIAP